MLRHRPCSWPASPPPTCSARPRTRVSMPTRHKRTCNCSCPVSWRCPTRSGDWRSSARPLRPGDLITAVNGTALDDPNRGNEILQTLSSSANATVTIQRNGQSLDLNLNLETVVNDAENAAAQANAAERRGGAFGAPLMGGGRLPGLRGSIGTPATGSGDEAGVPAPPNPEPPSDAADDQ